MGRHRDARRAQKDQHSSTCRARHKRLYGFALPTEGPPRAPREADMAPSAPNLREKGVSTPKTLGRWRFVKSFGNAPITTCEDSFSDGEWDWAGLREDVELARRGLAQTEVEVERGAVSSSLGGVNKPSIRQERVNTERVSLDKRFHTEVGGVATFASLRGVRGILRAVSCWRGDPDLLSGRGKASAAKDGAVRSRIGEAKVLEMLLGKYLLSALDGRAGSKQRSGSCDCGPICGRGVGLPSSRKWRRVRGVPAEECADTGTLWLLLKALPGLRKSSRLWEDHQAKHLESRVFAEAMWPILAPMKLRSLKELRIEPCSHRARLQASSRAMAVCGRRSL
eukprot:2073659-Amphidinium_carterae.3